MNVAESTSSSISILVLLKCSIETVVCLCTIGLNGLIIAALVHRRRLRTSQNLLLTNTAFSCIFFSLACIFSSGITLYFLRTNRIDGYICSLSGYFIITSCHALMFSYTLVTGVRFLTIVFPFNKKFTTFKYTILYLLLQWILTLFVSIASAFTPNRLIVFQSKPKFCTIDQHSPMLFIHISTGYLIPVLLISIMNLISYLNIQRARQIHTINSTQSSRTVKRQRRNLRLLRQFSFFTVFFVIGWAPFAAIALFDPGQQLPEIMYQLALGLPSICVLVDSSAMLNWNKAIHHQVHRWWRLWTTKRNRLKPNEALIRINQTIDNETNSIVYIGRM